MNKVECIELHEKAWLKDADTDNKDLYDYLSFISALYEHGMEISSSRLGIDLYHGEYMIFDIAMGK